MAGALDGIVVADFTRVLAGPYCTMLLADMGADVILVERPGAADEMLDLGRHAIVNRGKRSLALDLKDPGAVDAVLRLVQSADGLIEGMRPGVMERLGLGPEICLARNPALVYGRMTGWGQTGPLAQAAGHDLNYIALSGALWFAGEPDRPPMAPPTLVGDLGGGALYLAMGLLAAILNVQRGGTGQVVDAAIVDGSANLMNLLLSVHAAGHQPFERGRGLLDGPHWASTYRCADGQFVSVCALEPAFNALLFSTLGLADDADFKNPYDPRRWPSLREKLAAHFLTQPRQHWVDTARRQRCLLRPRGAGPSAQRGPRHLRGDARRDDAEARAALFRHPDRSGAALAGTGRRDRRHPARPRPARRGNRCRLRLRARHGKDLNHGHHL